MFQENMELGLNEDLQSPWTSTVGQPAQEMIAETGFEREGQARFGGHRHSNDNLGN